MSYYMQGYMPINPGTPQSYWSPIPGWQTNPLAAGPRVIAMSGCSSCGDAAVPDYNQTSYGVVYGVAATALLVGTLAGYAAGKRKQYRKNPKTSHVVIGAAAVGAVAIAGIVLMKKKGSADTSPEGGGVPADGARVSPALYLSNLTRTLMNPGGAPPPPVAPLPDARSGSGPAPAPTWGGSSWGGSWSL